MGEGLVTFHTSPWMYGTVIRFENARRLLSRRIDSVDDYLLFYS